VRLTPKGSRDTAHLVTEARRSRTEDIAYRERRYLLMMAIRVVCFAVGVALFSAGERWFAAIPVLGALFIPYFAVVFANGGREPTARRGFQAYEPNLPVPYSPSEQGAPGTSGDTGARGEDVPHRGSPPTEGA
jgi:Protein of unknown function (DUF3099)